MGNESTSLNSHELSRTYRPQQWLKQTLENNRQLWRNKYTHQLVKLYPLHTIPSIQDLNRYQLRSTHQYLVKVFNIAFQQYAFVCNSNQNGVLLVEHIPLKLKDVDFLDLQECLTVLHSSFRGFHTIQLLFQLVQPEEELIGFNEEGKTKVWLNRQLNINYTPKELKPAELNQFSRVIKIIEMVHKKIPANRQFYNLRQQILQQSVNYFQASIMIEQFAFREQLSLKRYIRTDLLTRQSNKGEGLRRNTTLSTVILTQRSNVTLNRRSQIMFNHNQLQKITSQGRLTPVKTNYIVRNQPFRVDEQICSSPATAVGSSPTLMGCKSITKITFNKNTEAFGSPKLPVSIKQNIAFVSLKEQQKIAQFSPVLPIGQPKLVAKENVKQVQEQKVKSDTDKEKKQVKSQNQTNKIEMNSNLIDECKQEIKCERSQPSLNVEGSPVTKLKFTQQKHSIIEQCQKYIQKSIHDSPQQQTYENFQVLQSQSGQEVQQSGMFRQIVETQGKDDPDFKKDEIKLQETTNKQIVEKVQTQSKQIPINFSSFAVQKVTYVENMSFAPNLTQNNLINQNRQGTTKSLDYQQKEEEHVSEANSQDSSSHSRIEDSSKKNFRLIESEQRVIYHNHTSIINEESLNQQPSAIPTNRYSYELQQQFSAICQQQKPFYQAYTPVQSKFDIVIKKDNTIEKEREPTERSNGMSAFGNLQQDGGYDNNKYKRLLPSDEFRIYRISSEYQTKTKKNYFDSSRQIKHQSKMMKIPNINEGKQQDFLAIDHLQKTLQMKCSKKVHKKSDEFDVSKLEQKLLKFSSSRVQIGSQNQKKQIGQTQDKSKAPQKKNSLTFQRNEDKKYNQLTYYEPTVALSKDYPNIQRYKTYNHQCKRNTQQYDATSRIKNKYSLNINNKYSNLPQQNINTGSYLVQQRTTGSYLGQQRTNNIYDKYGLTSYSKYAHNLLQPHKLKKKTDDLLEERYQKYVKQGRNRPNLSKQKSLDNIYRTYQITEKLQPQRGKRISYDIMRQFLWK